MFLGLLFILDNLCHEHRLADELIADKSLALHRGHAATQRLGKLQLEVERITGNDLLLESHVVNAQEIG